MTTNSNSNKTIETRLLIATSACEYSVRGPSDSISFSTRIVVAGAVASAMAPNSSAPSHRWPSSHTPTVTNANVAKSSPPERRNTRGRIRRARAIGKWQPRWNSTSAMASRVKGSNWSICSLGTQPSTDGPNATPASR